MKTTFFNLDRNLTRADPEFGRQFIGDLPDADVRTLLARFIQIDVLQNFEADPEIILESHRAKRIVRVSNGRLCLYNPGNMLEPALVLDADGVIRELSFPNATLGAPVLQTPADLGVATPVARSAVPVASVFGPMQRALLVAACISMAIYLASASGFAQGSTPEAQFNEFGSGDYENDVRARVVGVYMTGNQPGDRGISLDAGGAFKVFQLTSTGAPDLIRDDYRVGESGGKVCLLTRQPGGLISVVDDRTLVFCGETYNRLP